MAQENDIILIYIEDIPTVFARIEDISPDIKKNWYHVKLFLMKFPLQSITWILKDVYINGDEFTMNGRRMRLEKVVCPDDTPDDAEKDQIDASETGMDKKQSNSKGAEIISFSGIKKG